MHSDSGFQQPLIYRAFRYAQVRVGISVVLCALLLLAALTGYRVNLFASIPSTFSWLGHIVSTVAKWWVVIIVTLLILSEAHAWFGTIRSLGLPSFRVCRHVYRLTERAKVKSHWGGGAMVASGLGVLLVLLLLWQLTRLEIFLWLSGFRLAFMLHEPLDNSRPPAVLVLGASHREVTKLQAEIEMVVHQNRVVSLLNFPSVAGELAHEIHEWDVFRVPDNEDWERMVHALESITPIVVLDSRIQSQHVTRELQYMSHPKRIHKLIVVVADANKRPVVGIYAGLPSTRVCGTARLLAILKEMTRCRGSLPKPGLQGHV